MIMGVNYITIYNYIYLHTHILSTVNHILMVLTVRASQPQEKHFHTAWRGMERPGRNSAGRLYTLLPVAKVLPLFSNDLHTPAVSTEKEP